ncbi:MAG TPA: NAD(P)H-dependent oxidoreductase [Dongiaceae bacterium]|nr:NAD(P)H-dependent oxidoreductase [Dongiaceae bacterium]
MSGRLLVALDGSPAREGSVARLLAAMGAGARAAGGGFEHVVCNNLVVKPCQACGPDATPGYCIFHDDMDRVYAALEGAHAVLVGSPVHFDGVSAPLKAVIDRCNCVTPLVTLPGGGEDCVPRWRRTRRGAFVTACSDRHPYEMAERCVRGFLKWVGARWEATIAWQHADNVRGGVPDALLDDARRLGRRLIEGDPLEDATPVPAPGIPARDAGKDHA